MSASQARLLSLTARQSNLEFEGQQINQQRTNLSNQSANYYNSLLTMTVPTPPSTDDYTTVKYEFVIGGNDATIKQVLPQDNLGNYLVEYTTTLASIGVQENQAYKITASANNSSTKHGKLDRVPAGSTDAYDENLQYYVQTFREDDTHGTLTALTNESERYDKTRLTGNVTYYNKYGNQVEATEALDGGEIVNKFQENTTDNTYGNDDVVTYAASNDATFSTVGAEYKEAFLNSGLDINEFYQYKSSTGIRFAKKEDIERSANNSTISVMTYAVASMQNEHTNTLTGVQIEFDTTGRISSMTDAEGNTYTMTTSTITDDDAYEDAYNQYIYDQYVYDQKQNEINAHIEILQAQDKNLELRLSQLNTEHNAIQTEMEAVQKVLSKNIETSFKTFNA